jgi:cobalt/nickel transport protein
MRGGWGLAVLLLLAGATTAPAHYNMLLPDRASARKGQEVVFTYQWGHPFEHQLFDAVAPVSVIARAPDGKTTSLTRALEKIELPAGDRKVTGYRLRFTPEQRGDYLFVLRTPPIWMEEDGEFLQDTVKVVLHVQAQKGWEATSGGPVEVVPLTRPYGFQAGMAFQAAVHSGGEPRSGVLVEIERYNAAPPRQLPPDELITRTVRTDASGTIVTTLTEPGWWCLCASRAAGSREHEGKKYPVRERSILCVPVEER